MVDRTAEFPTRPVAQLLGSNGPIHSLTYSASPSTYILTGSSDRSIRLYNPSSVSSSPSDPSGVPSARLIQTYSGAHAYSVLSLSVSTDNARFASAGGDRTVFLWDVTTAQTLRRFGSASTTHSHTGRVNSVIFAGSADSLLVSAGHDCTVRIWDILSSGSQKPIQVLGDAKDAVTSVVSVPDTYEIITGSVDGRVRTYDIRNGKCVVDTLPAPVTSLCLSRDGKTLLVGTLDSKIRLMDRDRGTCLRTYGGEENEHGQGYRNTELRVQSVLGGKERFVVAGDELSGEGTSTRPHEGRVWAWDLLTGRLVAKVPVSWGGGGDDTANAKRAIGRDGKKKERKNVLSCIAWKENGFGNQFCVGGTSGVVTVFGEG
ncbi:putative mitogen-activated protein kinase organizer 1 [Podospora australis]|uniref:Mitogen-activated protein kinase organizer 1 n=1 Tax=Podospora australis TaxID=1536484 RepID=A0AAN7AK53_9PEZI|nr:putative mitogen-activated protein kinase organizer 1 [Podospora australis]